MIKMEFLKTISVIVFLASWFPATEFSAIHRLKHKHKKHNARKSTNQIFRKSLTQTTTSDNSRTSSTSSSTDDDGGHFLWVMTESEQDSKEREFLFWKGERDSIQPLNIITTQFRTYKSQDLRKQRMPDVDPKTSKKILTADTTAIEIEGITTVNEDNEDASNKSETSNVDSGAITSGEKAAVASKQNFVQEYALYITGVVALAAILGLFYCIYKSYVGTLPQSRSTDLPSQWRHVGILKNIYAFPIKSCAPVLLTEAECTYLGLQNNWLRDRFLMVVDERNIHVTAKDNPVLLTVQPSMWITVLTLRHTDMEPLQINLAQVKALRITQTAYVCDVGVPVMDCGGLAGEWFTKLLAQRCGKCRLVYYGSDASRPLKSAKQLCNKHNAGALSHEAPYHLISQSSVDELNCQLKCANVCPLNFRPNLVISGAKARDEVGWKFIKIGQNVFEITKTCTRCSMITLDPETGTQKSEEVLDALRRLRNEEPGLSTQKLESGPRMGVYMTLRSLSGGILSTNDPVLVSKGECPCEAGCKGKSKGSNAFDSKHDVIGRSGQPGTTRMCCDSAKSSSENELKKRRSVDKMLKEGKPSGDKICDEAVRTPSNLGSRSNNDDARSCRTCGSRSSVLIKNE